MWMSRTNLNRHLESELINQQETIENQILKHFIDNEPSESIFSSELDRSSI